MSRDRVDFEALLRHRPFVRALARSLVRDQADVDDLVQDTWVAALKNPPRHRGALRAWLASVVRKLAWTRLRGDDRRRARERKTLHPGPARSPTEALERAQWHRRLVDAVMDLDEPYRTTILLSYFEELSSPEIGRLQGVPPATVRTRLRRGLALLRERFDREEEGGRRAWTLALLPLALGGVRPPPPPAGAAWKAAAVGAALMAGLFVAVHLTSRRSPAPRRTAPGVPGEVPAATATENDAYEESAYPSDGHTLEVTVLAGGRAAAGARVVLARTIDHPWRWTPRMPWEPWKESRTDGDGQARFLGLADGYLLVAADLPGFARARAFVHLPQEIVHPVVLDLPAENPRRVTVLERESRLPIAGARVELWEAPVGAWLPAQPLAPTGGDGTTIVRGVSGADHFRLRVTRPGHTAHGPREVASGQDVVIELDPLDQSLDWPLATRLPEGTPVRLRRVNEAAGSVTHVSANSLRVTGLPRGTFAELLAIAPDGSFARLTAERTPLRFQPPPRLEVTVRDRQGVPLGGVYVRLLDPQTQNAVHPDGVTDARGTVVLPVYAAERMEVQLRDRANALPRTVRVFDPAGGDARMEVTLPVAYAATLRVRLDGMSALPGAFELLEDRTRLAPGEMAADEAHGILRVRARPAREGEPVTLHLLARGYLPAEVVVGAHVDLVVDLLSAGTLELHVGLRNPRQRYHLELSGSRPVRRGPWRFRLYPGPDHVVREHMMPPGRYRVRDTISGRSTQEFQILPGAGLVRLHFDLTEAEPRPAYVRGTIEAFADLDLRRAEVAATDTDGRRVAAEVASDGSFLFPWFGEGALTVRASHPALLPSDASAVTVTQPRDDLVLQLTPRHVAWVRVAGGDTRPDPGATAPRVVLFAGSEGPLELNALVGEDGVVRFHGFRPGEYRVWIDLPGFAPTLLGQVDLRGDDSDLGAIVLSRGSALRFRLLGGEDEAVPDLTIAAQALDAPRYQRSVRTTGARRAVLGGMGAGLFQVTAWERYSGRKVWSERILLDGTNDVAREIDWR